MVNLVYTTLLGTMSDDTEIARFEEQLNMPLPGREDRASEAMAMDELENFRALFGGG